MGRIKEILLLKEYFKSIDLKEPLYLCVGILIFVARYLKKISKKNQIKIYPERENEVTRILEFIKSKSERFVLGIDGEFGEGKTVLIEEVERKLKKEKSNIEFIKIRCILIEKDEVYNYIIKQLDKVLKKNLILSGYLSKIKISFLKGIESKFLVGISNIFIKETRIDDIENFKEIFQELNKTVVIVIEDIDRGTDSEKIDKLLSFVDEFSGENIKIIVNYGYNNLKSINEKYTRNFIEKYIPYTMTLTKIDFSNVLEKEVKKLNMDYKEFNFLRRLEREGYILREDINEKKPNIDTKFLKEMEEVLGQRVKLKFLKPPMTPRKIKIFLEEVKEYLDMKLDIETRIIIGYIYLKHCFYDEFYEKIDLYKEFEKSFPINFKCDENDEKFTLEEFEVLKEIEKGIDIDKNRWENEDQISHIEINDSRIHFFENKNLFIGRDKHFSINYFLEKLDISITNEDIEINEAIKLKFEEIAKKVKKLKFEIADEDSKDNYLIYGVLNYYIYHSNGKHEVEERISKINNAIKKLKYFASNEYKSSYGRFYDKFIIVLDTSDLQEASNKLNDLWQEYYNNEEKFESIFYMGENAYEKMMIVLNVFKDDKSKLKFLNLIHFQDKEIITDRYIGIFLTSKMIDFEISDKIIKGILLDNYKIENRDTLKKIQKNINFMLPKLELRQYDVEEIFNLDYKTLKDHLLARIYPIKRNNSCAINEVKQSILEYENFVDKLEDIFKKVPPRLIGGTSFSSSGKWVDWADEIINSETEDIKKSKLIEAFTRGNKGFKSIEQVYNEIEKNERKQE